MLVSVDTNVLVYAADRDAGERHALARSRLPTIIRHGVITQQVLGEFLNVGRKSKHLGESAVRAGASHLAGSCTVLPTAPDNLLQAFDLSVRHRLQFWDAVILTVCAANDVSVLLTEDMQDGATIGGVLILNPFGPANRDRLDALLPA